MLEVRNLSFRYGNDMILRNINFCARPGEITAIIGANGVGKSTLLKCIAGLRKGEGKVSFCGKDRNEMTTEQCSRIVSYLNQNSSCDAELNVYEVILLGLLNDLKFKVNKDDLEKVERVMKLLSLTPYANRKISALSGGQQQMVFIAQTLIKNPQILIMDEPTSALDLNRQFQLMDLLKSVTQKQKLTTLVTLHHLDITAKYADQVVVIQDGSVYQCGTPDCVFTPKMLRDVYRVDAEIYCDTRGSNHVIAVDKV